MIAWLLRLIGTSSDFVDHLDEVSLAFQHTQVLWIGLVLLLPAAWLIVRRQRQNLATVSRRLLIALSALRITVLVLLVTILAGPYLKLDHKSEKKPIVALLFDESQSMQLPAGPFDQDEELRQIAQAAGYLPPDGKVNAATRSTLSQMTRRQLVDAVTQHATSTLLEPLTKRFDVQYFSFAKTTLPFTASGSQMQSTGADDYERSASHLGDAIAHVLQDAGGRPVAGIVLFSDGQNTGGRSPYEAATAAGAVAAPVLTVPPGSPAALKDVAIVDVSASNLVSAGDTARVAVTVESQGFDGRAVKVELREGDKHIDVKDLVLHSAEQQVVELNFLAKDPGPHYLTIRIPPLPEEPEHLHANNTEVALVRVTEEKIKVLYLEGTPRWDFRFLKNAMRRDHGLSGRDANEPDIVLETEWRRQSSAAQAAALPQSLEELARYDLVILGDVSQKLLNSSLTDLLASAVREQGVGLLVEAGPQFMPHAFDAKLQDLMPVKLRSGSPGLEASTYKPYRLQLSPDGNVHEALRLFDDPGRNEAAWEQMPPYYWCAAAERPAPAAPVLVWNPSVDGTFGKLPLIAYHYAGQGKVMFVGTDSTWLWRQNVGDRYFYRFWGQSIRFIARREKNAKKSWLEARPFRAQPGETAQLELNAIGADGAPRTEPMLAVQAMSGRETVTVEMIADPAIKGHYTGRHRLTVAGDYRFHYEPGDGTSAAEAKVHVLPSLEELRHPNINRLALQRIATASGGKVVELPDLPGIVNYLKGEIKLVQLHREASVWDNWLMLALLISLYSLDVGLRRLAGLS